MAATPDPGRPHLAARPRASGCCRSARSGALPQRSACLRCWWFVRSQPASLGRWRGVIAMLEVVELPVQASPLGKPLASLAVMLGVHLDLVALHLGQLVADLGDLLPALDHLAVEPGVLGLDTRVEIPPLGNHVPGLDQSVAAPCRGE